MSCTARVANIFHLSKTVRGLTLKICDKRVTFKSGQWLDMVLPGVDEVTGYSLTSTPHLLEQEGMMQLAVKYSDHPITHWLHTKCTVGCEVNVKIGGDFFCDLEHLKATDTVVFIAGGLGINPIYSMLRSLVEAKRDENQAPTLKLFYSSTSMEELIFWKDLKEMDMNNANVECNFFTTKETAEDSSIKFGRITVEDLRATIEGLRTETARCFICGPPAMIDVMESYAKRLGITESNIYCERWWVDQDAHIK